MFCKKSYSQLRTIISSLKLYKFLTSLESLSVNPFSLNRYLEPLTLSEFMTVHFYTVMESFIFLKDDFWLKNKNREKGQCSTKTTHSQFNRSQWRCPITRLLITRRKKINSKISSQPMITTNLIMVKILRSYTTPIEVKSVPKRARIKFIFSFTLLTWRLVNKREYLQFALKKKIGIFKRMNLRWRTIRNQERSSRLDRWIPPDHNTTSNFRMNSALNQCMKVKCTTKMKLTSWEINSSQSRSTLMGKNSIHLEYLELETTEMISIASFLMELNTAATYLPIW